MAIGFQVFACRRAHPCFPQLGARGPSPPPSGHRRTRLLCMRARADRPRAPRFPRARTWSGCAPRGALPKNRSSVYWNSSSTMETSAPQVSCSLICTCAMSSEWPPMSKKLSRWRPNALDSRARRARCRSDALLVLTRAARRSRRRCRSGHPRSGSGSARRSTLPLRRQRHLARAGRTPAGNACTRAATRRAGSRASPSTSVSPTTIRRLGDVRRPRGSFSPAPSFTASRRTASRTHVTDAGSNSVSASRPARCGSRAP